MFFSQTLSGIFFLDYSMHDFLWARVSHFLWLASKGNQAFLSSTEKTGGFKEKQAPGHNAKMDSSPVFLYGKALLSLQGNSFHMQSPKYSPKNCNNME